MRLRGHIAAAAVAAVAGCATPATLDPDVAERRIALPGPDRSEAGNAAAHEAALRGEILAARGDPAEAAAELERAVAAAPGDAYLRCAMALVLVDADRLEEAALHLAEALEIEPSAELAWIGVAALREAQGDLAAAEEAARRAVRVEPREVEASLWLAGLYLREGRPERAAEVFRRAIGDPRSEARARLGLTEASIAVGRRSEALEHLAEYSRLSGADAEDLVDLLLERAGRADLEAASAFLEVVSDLASGSWVLCDAISRSASDLGLEIPPGCDPPAPE